MDNDAQKPVQLIINPRSGYGGRHHMLGELRASLRRARLEATEYVTKGYDDAARCASEIAGLVRAVLVWGGDGTVNAVANGL
ncbi:MAG: diacylglycerol kinase family protein, partial [Phycisphaerae bacterium]|nr:diacylglycerol kinase family protein [Phycisphaerae bacterium]